ncbi:MAG: hypothetical protein RJQ09_08425 [Cyclobacteriaceae bacterium]
MKRTTSTILNSRFSILAAIMLIGFTSFTAAATSKVDGLELVEVVVDEDNETISDVKVDEAEYQVILDQFGNLIYDATAEEADEDFVLEILLRKADYLFQVDGIRYYAIHLE